MPANKTSVHQFRYFGMHIGASIGALLVLSIAFSPFGIIFALGHPFWNFLLPIPLIIGAIVGILIGNYVGKKKNGVMRKKMHVYILTALLTPPLLFCIYIVSGNIVYILVAWYNGALYY